MEEINIGEFFLYLKKHFWIFISIIMMVIVVGIVYSIVLKTPMYVSTTSLTLAGVDSEQATLTTNDVTFNSKMLATYQEVITSRKVLEQVIDNLKLNKSVGELASNISIKNVTDSIVLKISVTDENRTVAKDVANEVARVFGNEIQDMYHIKNVIILDKAIVADNPYNLNYGKSVIMSVGVGFFLALMVLFLLFYFDNTIKSVEQVEGRAEMIVLGAIPDYSLKQSSKKRRKR